MKLYRIFFNLNKGAKYPWCIDTGKDTSRQYVLHFVSNVRIIGALDSSSHPRAWNQVDEECHFEIKNEIAYFNPIDDEEIL